MAKAEAAHQVVSNVKFDLEDINNLKESVLISKETDHFFSKPIKMSLVSSQLLAERLVDLKDPSFIPHPFVFTPSRKEGFRQLLPFPQKKDTIIEGFSQSGKSNFGCHLALIYRMKPQNHAVIYIGNVGDFNDTPLSYLMEEIFYWFYEEIRDSPKVQTMLGQIFLNKFDHGMIVDMWWKVFLELKTICNLKGKKIVFIFDQYNRKSEESDFKSFFKLFSEMANAKILITTNTDPNAEILKLRDFSNKTVLELHEIDHVIDESEMLKVIQSFFPNQTQDFAEQLFFHTKSNLTLFFLFYNHCCNNKLLEKGNLNVSAIYGTFSKEYIKENRNRHQLWSRKNQNISDFNLEALQELMAHVDRDYPFPNFDEILLDKRYIYISKDDRLHSINPLISKMFLERYWKANDIEKFLNNRGKMLNHALFGELFEWYWKEKSIELKKELKLPLGDKEIEFNFEEKGHVTYGQNHLPKGIKLKGNKYEVIYFHVPKTKGNGIVLMRPIQDNFPLFDDSVYEKSKKRLLMISVKLNSGFLYSKHTIASSQVNFEEYFVHYYEKYIELAKKQFGK